MSAVFSVEGDDSAYNIARVISPQKLVLSRPFWRAITRRHKLRAERRPLRATVQRHHRHRDGWTWRSLDGDARVARCCVRPG